MRVKFWLRLLIVPILLLVFFFCRRLDRPPGPDYSSATIHFSVMGTVASATLYGSDPGKLEEALDRVVDVMHRVERICNVFDPDSELSRLNRTPPEAPFACSPELWEILVESRRYYDLSGGLFDVSAKPLMELWGFHRKRESLPTDAEVEEARSKVGLCYVAFDAETRSVTFGRAGMSIDLGGIAKGYAVDRAAEAVLSLGIRRGLINLAGNVRCLPEPPPDREWYEIGIRNPVRKTDVCGLLRIDDRSVATSGNYERYVVIEGKRHTHIMNPLTGHPVTDMLGVTVVAETAICVDALSTAVFIGGGELAAKLCREIPGTGILIIRSEAGKPDSPPIIETFGEISTDIDLSVPDAARSESIRP
jgi:thiamine biosynthesis lipoprotein